MKKANLVGLLALASCVVLSGCNKAKPVELSLSDEIPNEILMGEEFDLEEYVTLLNATDYQVSLDEESEKIAEVDGHTIKANDEGEINFTVSAGGKTAEGTINSISKIRKEFREQTKDVGIDYGFFSVNNKGQIDDAIIHNENYFFIGGWDYDESTDTSIPGGVIKFGSGNYYQFTCDDLNGTNPVVSKKKVSSAMFDYYNKPFNNENLPEGSTSVDTSKLNWQLKSEEDSQGKTQYYLTLEEDENFTLDSWLRERMVLALSGYEFTHLDVYLVEGDEENYLEFVPYVIIEGAKPAIPETPVTCTGHVDADKNGVCDTCGEVIEYYVCDMFFTTDEEILSVPGLANVVEPQSANFDALKAALKAMIAGKNFTFDYSSLWQLNPGSTEIYGNPFDDPRFSSYVYSVWNNDKERMYATQDGVYYVWTGAGEEDPTSVFGYRQNGADVMQFAADETTGVITEGLLEANCTIWGNPDFASFTAENLGSDALYEDMFCAQAGTTETGDQAFVFSGLDAAELLKTISGLAQYCGFGYNFDSIDEDDLGFFTIQCTLAADGSINIFAYYGINIGQVIYYVLDMTFSNIGTTVMPAIN